MSYAIDVFNWYAKRELVFCPKHFVIAQTPLTEESKYWIVNYLNGRYAILPPTDFESIHIFNSLGSVAFEDPKEATLYELKWS